MYNFPELVSDILMVIVIFWQFIRAPVLYFYLNYFSIHREHIGTIRHITPTADSNAYMLIIHIHYSNSSLPILHTCEIDLLFLSYLGLPDSIMHASFFKLFNDIKHNRLSRNLIHRDAFECLCKVRMRFKWDFKWIMIYIRVCFSLVWLQMSWNIARKSYRLLIRCLFSFLGLDMPLIFVVEKSDSEGENHLSFSCWYNWPSDTSGTNRAQIQWMSQMISQWPQKWLWFELRSSQYIFNEFMS